MDREAARKRAKKALAGGVKGFVGLPSSGIPSVKRTALLAGTYVSAWYFMRDTMEEEKYFVHQNTVTLYRPRMYTALKGDDPTDAKNYLVTSETKGVKQDTWVQMKIPGVFSEGGMPLYLASPCKAAVSVTKGICKCKEYGNGDKVLVRFSTDATRWVDMDEGPVPDKTFSEKTVYGFPEKEDATSSKEYIGDMSVGEEKSQLIKDINAKEKELKR